MMLIKNQFFSPFICFAVSIKNWQFKFYISPRENKTKGTKNKKRKKKKLLPL